MIVKDCLTCVYLETVVDRDSPCPACVFDDARPNWALKGDEE